MYEETDTWKRHETEQTELTLEGTDLIEAVEGNIKSRIFLDIINITKEIW